MEVANNQETVIALSELIAYNLAKNEQGPLDLLFSITLHVLARDTSGKFVDSYCENLKKEVKPYIEGYRQLKNQKNKPLS